MKRESEIIIENDLFYRVSFFIENRYKRDKFNNIVFEDTSDLIEKYNEFIEIYADNLGESQEEVRKYLIKLVECKCNDKSKEGSMFKHEYEAIKGLLTINQDKEKNVEQKQESYNTNKSKRNEEK